MKEHDFLATLFKNPDLSLSDLKNNNITPDNTQLLSKDEYKNNDEVIKAFSDESGKFDEVKFDNYYNAAQVLYADYANDDLTQNVIENFTYSSDAWFAPKDAEYREDNPIIHLNNVPSSFSEGISYLTERSDLETSKLSVRELAQREKVWDYENNKWLDYSPNNKSGLFRPWSLPTLVLAQYDEDGTHLENGVQVEHKKGDLKFNDNGRPYYETIGDRDIYSKDVLKNLNILTVDGSKWNKIDIFDNDDVKKSIPKTIANLVVRIAPMFIPYVGEIYGYIGAADGIIRTAPLLLKSVDNIITFGSNNAVNRGLTKWEKYVSRFDQDSSDWGREHLVSVEGLGNLVSDISRQLFEQKAVSTIPVLLNKTRKVENINKVARNSQKLALSYMAATSAQNVYSDFKQAGANDVTASLGMLGSTLALYKLMNIDYFRNNIFKDTFMDENEVRASLRAVSKDAATKFAAFSKAATSQKEAATFVKKFSDFYQDKLLSGLSKKGVTGLINRGASEATEEVMEEVTTDLIKATTEALNALGIPVTNKNESLDFGWSAKDFAERYGMAAAGGFLGGVIFAGQDRYGKWLNKKMYHIEPVDLNSMQKLIYYIANGNRSEIDEYLDKWHDKGVLGSKNLSIDGRELLTVNGEYKFIPNTEGINQNDAVYYSIKGVLDSIEQALYAEVPDLRLLTAKGIDELKRLGYSDAEVLNNGRLITASSISALGDYSSFQNDLYDTISEIIATKTQLSEKIRDLSGANASTEDERKQQAKNISENAEVKKLQEKLKKLRKDKDDFFSGAKNKYYAGQALFAANEGLQKAFVNVSLDEFTKLKYGFSYNSFDEDKKKEISDDYNAYIAGSGRKSIYRAFDLYLALSKKYTPILNKHGESLDKLFNEQQQLPKLWGREYFFQASNEYNQLLNQLKELRNIENPEEDTPIKIAEIEDKMSELSLKINAIKLNPRLAEVAQEDLNFGNIPLNGEGRITFVEESIKNIVNSEEFNSLKTALENTRSALHKLISIYKSDAETGKYRFDDAELNAFLRTISEFYVKTGGTASRFEALRLYAEAEGLDPITDFLGTSIEYSDISQKAINIIDSFIKNLGIDNSLAMNDYNRLLELLRENTELLNPENESDFKLLMSYIMPSIDGRMITDILSEFDGYRSKINYSAFLELAKEIGSDENNLKLLDLVAQELKNLNNSSSIKDYLQSPSVARALNSESINKTLSIIQALIKGAYDGTNDIMNNFEDTSKDGNDESIPKLAIISDKAAKHLYSQGEDLARRIGLLNEISAYNNNNSLRVHKETAIIMRPKWISKILNLSDQINKVFDLDGNERVEELWNAANSSNLSLDDITEENYSAFEQAAIIFETALYDVILNKYDLDSRRDSNSCKELAEKLVSIFDVKNLLKSGITRISNDRSDEISDLDIIYHLATLISVNSNDFYNVIKSLNITNKDGDLLAPIYGQQYAIHQSIGQIINPDLFNNILNIVYNVNNLDTNESNKEFIEYAKNKPNLYNLSVVLGGAGSGKTVGVIKSILTSLGYNCDSIDIKFIAKESSQAKNAAENAGFLEGYMTIDEYFTKTFGEKITNYSPNTTNLHIETNQKLDKKGSVFDENKQLKILVVDEIETLSEAELRRITEDALENNIFILGFGDLKQPGPVVNVLKNGETISKTTDIEDCNFIKCPTLTTSMRAQTVAKNENAKLLGTALDAVLNETSKNPYITINERNALIDTTINGNNVLCYWEDPKTGEVFGDMKVITQDEFDNKLAQLKNLNGDIKIIVEDDDAQKYEKYKVAGKIEIIKYSERAGVEADYVLVDIDLNKHSVVSGERSSYLLTREFYTLTQRSRKGTVIKLPDDFKLFEFKNNKTYAQVISTSQEDIKDFRTWYIDGVLSFIGVPNESALKEAISKSPLLSGYISTNISTRNKATVTTVDSPKELAEKEQNPTPSGVTDVASSTQDNSGDGDTSNTVDSDETGLNTPEEENPEEVSKDTAEKPNVTDTKDDNNPNPVASSINFDELEPVPLTESTDLQSSNPESNTDLEQPKSPYDFVQVLLHNFKRNPNAEITDGKQLLIAFSNIFNFGYKEIFRIMHNFNVSTLDSVLSKDSSVAEELRKVVKMYYGAPGVTLLNDLLNNFGNLQGFQYIDRIKELKPIINSSYGDRNGLIRFNGKSIEGNYEAKRPVHYATGENKIFINEIDNFIKASDSLFNQDDFYTFKSFKTVFDPQIKSKINDGVVKSVILDIASRVRTGLFNNIYDSITDNSLRRALQKAGFTDNSETEMYVLPYNDQYKVLVSRHYSEQMGYFDVPLMFIKSDKIGKYTGTISLSSKAFAYRTNTRTPINELQQKENIFFPNYFGVINGSGNMSDVNEQTAAYLKRNDGKPMAAFTDEIAIKKVIFDNNNYGIYTTDIERMWSITDYDRLSLMGVQCCASIEEFLKVVKEYIEKAKVPVSDQFVRNDREGSETVPSEVLTNISLLVKKKDNGDEEFRKLLPENRAGQLISLLALSDNNVHFKLTGLLNTIQNSLGYNKQYVLDIWLPNEASSKKHIAYDDKLKAYIVGEFNTKTGKFEQIEGTPIWKEFNLKTVYNDLFGISDYKNGSLPCCGLSYHQYRYGESRKNGPRYFGKDFKWSINWNLAVLLQEVLNTNLDSIKTALQESDIFVNGIYLDDATVKNENATTNSHYGLLISGNRTYDTDFTDIQHSIYTIDTDSIEYNIVTNDNKQTLSDFIKSSKLNITANTLDEANKKLSEMSNNWIYQQIIEAENGFELIETDDDNFRNWFISKFGNVKNIDYFYNIMHDVENTKQFDVFNVVNGTGICYKNTKGQWTVTEINDTEEATAIDITNKILEILNLPYEESRKWLISKFVDGKQDLNLLDSVSDEFINEFCPKMSELEEMLASCSFKIHN